MDLFFISHLNIIRELENSIKTAQNPSLFFWHANQTRIWRKEITFFFGNFVLTNQHTQRIERKKSIIVRILQFFINLIMAKFFFFQIQFSIMKRNLLTFRQKDSKKYLSLFPFNYYHIFSLLVPSYVLSCLSLSKRKKYWNKSNRITLPYL